MDVKFKINYFNVVSNSSESEIISLKVNQNDTIVKIKQKICKISKHVCDREKYFVLKFGGINLNDNLNLSSYHIQERDTVIFDKIHNFDPGNIVVINISGNFHLPSVIQIECNRSIRELKEIISAYSNVREYSIFMNGDELGDNVVLNNNNNFNDDCQIFAIQRQEGVLKLNCLMKNQECLDIDFAITNKVYDIKQRVSNKYHYNIADFVLFHDKKCLDDDRFIFEYEINLNPEITYCLITKLQVTLEDNPMTRGTFCDIYTARDDRNVDVIVKKYPRVQNEESQRYKQLLNELTACCIIKENPRFVQLLAFYTQDNGFYVVLEYMEKGSLDQYLKEYRSVPIKTLASWSKQILEALQFLNENSVIYRDLKPSNIMLASCGIVKLGGFSLSKYLMGVRKEELERGFVQTKPQNYRYMAPEVFNDEEYGIKIDVWSLGVILLLIITGHPPYPELDDIGVAIKISRDRAIQYEIPERTPDSLTNFIAQCLQGNPQNRKTAEELLTHNFLDDVEEYSELMRESVEFH